MVRRWQKYLRRAEGGKVEKETSLKKVGSITLRLKKGMIACSPDQRATVRGLGLKHRHQERTLENTSSVRGMIKKVLHLVEIVQEIR